MAARLPFLSKALVTAALPADVRRTVLADLEEVFQRKAAAEGESAARRWYRREAISFSLRFIRERAAGRATSIRFSLIDVRLAARMVWKYPGITIVGGLAIATAIAVTTVSFEITHDFSNPTLPLPGSDRIVTLLLLDPATNQPETRMAYDLARWRSAPSIEAAGGFLNLERNLILSGGEGEVVRIAQMSADGFRVAGVAPLMGRALIPADERKGAPRVVVLGFGVWRKQFDGDPQIIGRLIRLGAETYNVIGVMPERFAFPVSHSMWVAMPAFDDALERFDGPGVHAFARLRAGATMARANTELAAISGPLPMPPADRRESLRPRAMPYAAGLIQPGLLDKAFVLQWLLVVILVICCANVATLVFARTATRQSEITVRTALGASRARILSQFFVEALALAVVGAAAGLTVANMSIQWLLRLVWSTGFPKPFWWDDSIAPATYLYAAALTLVVGVICGVVPALKGTGRKVNSGLQEAAGRGTSLRFGAGWTTIIVVQVALVVVLLPTALLMGWDGLRALPGAIGFPASEYLAATLDFEASGPDAAAKQVATFRDLAARVAKEPDVTGVAFSDRFPGMPEQRMHVDVDGLSASNRELIAYTAVVAPGFFEALQVPVVAGRIFGDADAVAHRPVAVVNQLFVTRVLEGRNPLGRRVRFSSRDNSEQWMEIIGVVPDLGMSLIRPEEGAGLYRVAAPGEWNVSTMAVHVASGAAAFAPRLRTLALSVNPDLRLRRSATLDTLGRSDQMGFRFFSLAFVAVAVIGVVLSTTGIYSMMSFTVSRRTREIAIRAALGANPRRIVFAIFSKAVIQVGAGALAGVAMIVTVSPKSLGQVWLPMGLALFMLVVGVFACAAPARRALKIEPSDALKDLG